MPWVDAGNSAAYFTPAAAGPATQTGIVQNTPPLAPTTIAGSGNYTTDVIVSDGYKIIAVGLTSTQAGALNIQRYLDPAGTIAAKAVDTVAIVANTPLVFVINSSTEATPIPFAAFKITATNSSGSTATVTKFFCLLQSS